MFFCLGEATSLGEGKSEFKPVKLRLKIDLVSYPVWEEGLGKYINLLTLNNPRLIGMLLKLINLSIMALVPCNLVQSVTCYLVIR